MSLIKWDDSIQIGISTIDGQHKILVDLINTLFDAMKEQKGNEIIRDILKKLVAYTQTHFANEEKYFEEFSYPDAAAHIEEHKKFISEIKQFITDFKSGKISLSTDVMQFLSKWLQDHIKKTDHKYAEFLKSKGVV